MEGFEVVFMTQTYHNLPLAHLAHPQGITSALRGYCFSILNNRMTMRLRWGFMRMTMHPGGVGSGVRHEAA